MISIEWFYGKAHSQAFTTLSYALTPSRARFFCLRPSTAGLYVETANPDDLVPYMKVGGPMLYVWNTDPTHDFDIKDHNGTTIVVATAGDIAELWLGVDNDQQYVWGGRVKTPLS